MAITLTPEERRERFIATAANAIAARAGTIARAHGPMPYGERRANLEAAIDVIMALPSETDEEAHWCRQAVARVNAALKEM